MKKRKIDQGISSLLMLCATMFMLLLAFSCLSPYFFTLKNITNLLQQVVVLGVASAGLTLVILSGSLDLSIGAVMALAGIFAAKFLALSGNWAVGLAGGLAVGLLCGLINGFMINALRMNPLIVTLGMASVWEGVTKLLNNGVAIGIFNEGFSRIGQGRFLGIPVSIYILFLVYVLIGIIMKYLRFGREAFAVGGNPKAALYSGINIKRVRFMTYTLASFLAGVAGIIYASMVGSGTVSAGSATTLDAIAAVVLGGASLTGGSANIIGTFIGVVLLGTIDNGLSILGVSSFWQLIVKGSILLLAVFIDVIRGGDAYE